MKVWEQSGARVGRQTVPRRCAAARRLGAAALSPEPPPATPGRSAGSTPGSDRPRARGTGEGDPGERGRQRGKAGGWCSRSMGRMMDAPDQYIDVTVAGAAAGRNSRQPCVAVGGDRRRSSRSCSLLWPVVGKVRAEGRVLASVWPSSQAARREHPGDPDRDAVVSAAEPTPRGPSVLAYVRVGRSVVPRRAPRLHPCAFPSRRSSLPEKLKRSLSGGRVPPGTSTFCRSVTSLPWMPVLG